MFVLCVVCIMFVYCVVCVLCVYCVYCVINNVILSTQVVALGILNSMSEARLPLVHLLSSLVTAVEIAVVIELQFQLLDN